MVNYDVTKRFILLKEIYLDKKHVQFHVPFLLSSYSLNGPNRDPPGSITYLEKVYPFLTMPGTTGKCEVHVADFSV